MFSDQDPSRIFLSGVGQGANMVNACFFAYKGKKPLGGIMPYLGMIPLKWSHIDEYDPDFAVLKATPIMLINGEKDPDVPVDTAKKSYSYFKTYVYDTAASKAIYNAYTNPNIISGLGKNLIGNT